MRSASAAVSISPSMTPMRTLSRSRSIVRSNRVVLPAPGPLMRLTTRTQYSAICCRISRAIVSLAARIFCAIVTLTKLNSSPSSRAKRVPLPLLRSRFDLHLKNVELVARNDLRRPRTAGWTLHNEIQDSELPGAMRTVRAMRHVVYQQIGVCQDWAATRHHLKAKCQCIHSNAAGLANFEAHALYPCRVALAGPGLDRLGNALSNGQFVHGPSLPNFSDLWRLTSSGCAGSA